MAGFRPPRIPRLGRQPFWGTPFTVNNVIVFKEKRIKFLFQQFQPLYRQPVAFKTLEHSISYNPSNEPGEKKRENALSATLYTLCLQQHKFLMMSKALL